MLGHLFLKFIEKVHCFLSHGWGETAQSGKWKKSVNPREQLFAEPQSLTGQNLAVKKRLLKWLKN
jgi:hypothetical protein